MVGKRNECFAHPTWLMMTHSIKNLVVLIFSFLLAWTANIAWSQEPVENQTKQFPSEQFAKNVPQTPEGLLLAIKGVIANKDKTGESICSEWLGIPPDIWVDNVLTPGSKDKRYVPSSSMFPPAPFHFSSALIGHRDTLINLELSFYRNPDFRMTPEEVQKIFGKPTNIWVYRPKSEWSYGEYRVKYRYDYSHDQNSYYMDITFHNNEEVNIENQIKFLQHSPEQVQSERARRKELNAHSGYLPVSLELNL